MESKSTLLTVPEVAQWLRVPISTVYDLVQRQILPSLKVGRALRFDPHDLEDYLRRQKRGRSPAGQGWRS